MATSEARIAANRINALRSTGPKTVEGKERSRANSLKHGMTGAGVVLPTEDAQAIEQRFEGFQADYAPETDSGRCLVRRAAMLSIRIERCAVHEAAAVSANMRRAADDFDEARMAEVDALMDSIVDGPGLAVRRLRRMPEGVDRMIETWIDLRSDLAHHSGGCWTLEHQVMAESLTGRRSGGFGTCRIEELSMAVRGDFTLLAAEDGAKLADPARRAWARGQLVGLIDSEVAKLREHRETLDLDAIESERAGASAVAMFDVSREATLARKYEAAAERMMYRALKEMKQVEAANADRAEESVEPLGSFSTGSMTPVDRTPSTPATAPMPVAKPSSDPRLGSTEEFSMVPMSIGQVN